MNRILTVIIALGIVGVSLWFFQQQHAERSHSEQLVQDVLHIVRNVADIRTEVAKDGFEGAYAFEQLVSDAKRRINPWLSDTHVERRAIADWVQNMLGDLESASQIYVAIHKGGSEEQMAQFKVKLDSGRMKTIDIAATILKQENLLNSTGKRHIIEYINQNFSKELTEFQATKGDPAALIAPEVAAVFVIKREYEKQI